MLHWIETHGFEVFAINWFLASLASALPTRSDAGPWYRFASKLIQVLAANPFRVQEFRSFIGLQENPTTVQGIEAQAVAQAIDPAIQGVVTKPESK